MAHTDWHVSGIVPDSDAEDDVSDLLDTPRQDQMLSDLEQLSQDVESSKRFVSVLVPSRQDDISDDELAMPLPAVIAKQNGPFQSRTPPKSVVKNALSPRPVEKDIFDVPSSDPSLLPEHEESIVVEQQDLRPSIPILENDSDDSPLSSVSSSRSSSPLLTSIPFRSSQNIPVESPTLTQIPTTIDLESHFVAPQLRTRSLRERKAIQLHPYAVEGMLYRQTMHSRGIQAVRLANGESQVETPNAQETSSSSQMDGDFVMTQDSQPQDTQYIESVDLRDVGRELEGQVVNGGKRRRLANWKERRASIDLHEFLPGMDEFDEDLEAEGGGENPTEADLQRKAVFRLPPLFANVTMHKENENLEHAGLQTPISLVSDTTEAQLVQDDESDSDSDPGLEGFTDAEPHASEHEASAAESAIQENLKRQAKRLRGFLPASYVRLDQAEQTRNSRFTNEQRRIRDRETQERLRKRREERDRAAQEPIREIGPIFDSDETDNEPTKKSRIDRFFSKPVPEISISRSPTRSPSVLERRHSEPIMLSGSDPDTDDMEDNRIDRMLGPGRRQQSAYQTVLDGDLKIGKKRRRTKYDESAPKRTRISIDHFHQLKYPDAAGPQGPSTGPSFERSARRPLHPISRNLKQPVTSHHQSKQSKTYRSGQGVSSRSYGSARQNERKRHERSTLQTSGPPTDKIRSSRQPAVPIRRPQLQSTRRPAEGSKLTSFVNNFTPTHVAQLEVPRQRYGRVNIPDLDDRAPSDIRAFRHDPLNSRDVSSLQDARRLESDIEPMDGVAVQQHAIPEQRVKQRRRHHIENGKASSRTELHEQRPLLGPFLDNLSPPPSAYLDDGPQIDTNSDRQWQETRCTNLFFRATSTFDVEPLSPGLVVCHGPIIKDNVLKRILQPQRNEDIDSCFKESWVPADTQNLRQVVAELSAVDLDGETNLDVTATKVKDLVDLLCISTKDFSQQDSQPQLEIWKAIKPLFEHYLTLADQPLLASSPNAFVSEIAHTCSRLLLLLLHVKKSISTGSVSVEVDQLLLKNMKALLRILTKFTDDIKQTMNQCMPPSSPSVSPIPSHEKLLEAAVVLKHVAENKHSPTQNIWSLIGTSPDKCATNLPEMVEQHEELWGSSFLLLPVSTIDSHGVVTATEKYPPHQGWKTLRTFVVDVLNSFDSASPPLRKQLLVYIKFMLLRCLNLIATWHWDQCEAIIGTFFDFFARNQLRHLESPVYSALVNRHVSSVIRNPASVTDYAFLLLLKLIVAAVNEKRATNEKQIGNLVFRLIPNHGRSYPRDQDIAAHDLDSLQNHHDLLWVLLAFTPKQYRPRLSQFENLVSFQSSHLEACRINIKTWYHCARSMLEQDPTIDELEPLFGWFKTALKRAVEQHRKTRSDVLTEQAELAKAGRPMLQKDVEAQIRRNESSIELILVDMAYALSETLKTVTDPNFACRFLDCGVVDLLSVGKFRNRDVDTILRVCFDSIQTVLRVLHDDKENEASDDSQGFGDWSGFEELEGEPTPEREKAHLPNGLERELYALLGKVCGVDKMRSTSFIDELVITWARLCCHNVRNRTATWEDYTGEYATHSWLKLRDTAQTRQLALLFYSEVLRTASSTSELTSAVVQTLLVRLTDPAPLFTYQHVLLNAVLNKGLGSILDDLPFSTSPTDGLYHIVVPELLQCRVAVFASIFSSIHRQLTDEMSSEKRHLYKKHIVSMQASMKARILEKALSEDEHKAYTAFVYRVIELMQEHIPEVAYIDPIFMDSSKFPQLHQDPAFVVSKLKNLARHLVENRSPKQLVSFVFHVLEQALQDGAQQKTEKHFLSAAEICDLSDKSLQIFLLTEFLAQCVISVKGNACGYVLIAPLVNAITALFSRILSVVNTKDLRYTELVQEYLLKHCDVLFKVWAIIYQDITSTDQELTSTTKYSVQSYGRRVLAAFEKALHHCIDVLVFVSNTTNTDLSKDWRVLQWQSILTDCQTQSCCPPSAEDVSPLATFTRNEARAILDRWSFENGKLTKTGAHQARVTAPPIQGFDETVEQARQSLLRVLNIAIFGRSDGTRNDRHENSWAVTTFLRWED